jgi:processive 1,2-diacylglycerol beta-glucosyltransferase
MARVMPCAVIGVLGLSLFRATRPTGQGCPRTPSALGAWRSRAPFCGRRRRGTDGVYARLILTAFDAPVSERSTPRRVLILSADVGAGHVAAARALTAALERDGDAHAVHIDGLHALGGFLRHLIRDGYHLQLRHAPWLFSLLYGAFRRFPILQVVGRKVLYRLGNRRLGQLLRAHPSDVVVSTHPAITSVLGEMRRRGRLQVPLCAPITDLADWKLWASPGADLHLVAHKIGVVPVEQVAGHGSVRLAHPLVAPGFLEHRDRQKARRQLGLPAHGTVVVISGGGWGVGDLDGAARIALTVPGATVVCLCGSNEVARLRLGRLFAAEPRMRLLSFTSRMHELLHAADALVHSTGGLTSLEALACGCPVIAYGAQIGHIKVHNRTLEALGLAKVCESRDQLRRALLDAVRVTKRQPALVGGEAPGPLFAGLGPRVLPMPAWRLGLTRVASLGLTAVAISGWGLGTDDAYSLTARALDLDPLTTVATPRRAVSLLVETTPQSAPAVAAELHRHGAQGTLAFANPPATAQLRNLRHGGIAAMPQLRRAPTPKSLSARKHLQRVAGRLGVEAPYWFLLPSRGISPTEYLVADAGGGRPVAGDVRIEAGSGRPLPVLHDDQVVVVRVLAASSRELRGLDALVSSLEARGLSSVPLPAPAKVPTAREPPKATTPATTVRSPTTITPPASGVVLQASPARSGAASTGTRT